jgi:thiol-disulfide isomerase/thioredoxin
MDGQTFDSAQHLGKVVLIDFWFRKCQPCIRALPHVDKLRQTYSKDQLEIVAVNNDERKSTAASFLKSNPHDWPQIYDKDLKASLVGAYGVRLFPTFVVIDQLGNIQYKGSSVSSAAAKVAELVQVPSLPGVAAPVGVVASNNRPG